MKVYLAGPEVFLPDAGPHIADKHARARAAGFDPVGADLGPLPDAAFDKGVAIFRLNVDLMNAAEVCIANVTPFRGPSADVGTVWELGFMYGQGKPCFAYSADPRPYMARITAWNGAPPQPDAGGALRLADGQMVEDHGMVDNLMIDGSLALGGVDVLRPEPGEGLQSVYARCLAMAATHLGLG